MTKRMKRLFSVMLVVSMMMSMLSVSAFAEELSRFDCDCETRHTHGDTCYEMQPDCGYEENELICGLALHKHEEACYTLHEAHVDGCYQLVCTINAEDNQYDCNTPEHICGTEGVTCSTPLLCTDAEHEHTGDCYSACTLQHTHSEECHHTHTGFDGECYEKICGMDIGSNLTCTVTEHAEHVDTCYHHHIDSCYKPVLVCEESVFHEHTSACFQKKNGKSWPNVGVCFELSCEYKDMKIHGHEYTCLTEAAKEEILNTYPAASRTVPQFSEPYIFIEMQTYLPGGYRYHDPVKSKNSNPQLWMMANVQGMEPGDIWKHNVPETKRFVAGVSNFAAAYCCDVDTNIKQYHSYRQVNLEDANYYDLETAQKIRSVMMNSYPWLSVEEMQARLAAAGFADAEEIDEATMISAAQFAVWRYANTDTIGSRHYWYTAPSSYYPVLTAHWEKGGISYYRPEENERMQKVVDYLVGLAERAPEAAPESQIVVSQVEVANLIMTPDENGTYTVDLQVMLNGEYDNSHEDTNIMITAAAGDASASVAADGRSVYNLKLEGYTEGENITVTMSGTQHLPLGVYFYEPYAAAGQDVRKVSQNLVGINEGIIPVGDQVVLDGTKLDTASLSLKKVNEDGKVLTGAEFELSYVSDEENIALGTYAVDENGTAVIEGLMAGKSYQLTETKAPSGYDAITEAIKLEVGEEGGTIVFNLPNGVTCDTAEDENYVLTVVNCETPLPPPTYNPPTDPIVPVDPVDPPEEPPLVDVEDPEPPLDDVEIEDSDVPLTGMEEEDVPLTDVPKTSDSSNMMLWMMMALLSAAALVGIRIAERKER